MHRFLAGLDGVTFTSNGYKILGGFYRAAGNTPRPTAILLHGLPGVEKNTDIAYALRAAGWNCLYFHYRGSWGSQGNYSLEGRYDDLIAALAWLQQQDCVDSSRIILIGHSAGGYLALTAAARNRSFKAVVALCPLISSERAPLSQSIFDEFATMLQGITGSELQSQWNSLVSIESRTEKLHHLPILMITGREDDLFPPEHYAPFVEALPTIEWHELANGDHAFSECRQEIVRLTLNWLNSYVITDMG